MNERVMRDVEPSCFRNELDFGVVREPSAPRTRRKKNTIRWARLLRAVPFAILAWICWNKAQSSLPIPSQEWALGFALTSFIGVLAPFINPRRRRPRGWHSKNG